MLHNAKKIGTISQHFRGQSVVHRIRKHFVKLKFIAGLVFLPLLINAAAKPATKSNRPDGMARQKLAH